MFTKINFNVAIRPLESPPVYSTGSFSWGAHLKTQHAILRFLSLSQISIFLAACGLWPPLWPSGQSYWLQIQRSGFSSRRYQIFWAVVGLERCPRVVSTFEELLGRKSSCSGQENREYGRRDLRADHATPLFPQTLALTSPTSGGRSVGIVRSQTQATQFFICGLYI
jgi:hypothetical protein